MKNDFEANITTGSCKSDIYPPLEDLVFGVNPFHVSEGSTTKLCKKIVELQCTKDIDTTFINGKSVPMGYHFERSNVSMKHIISQFCIPVQLQQGWYGGFERLKIMHYKHEGFFDLFQALTDSPWIQDYLKFLVCVIHRIEILKLL